MRGTIAIMTASMWLASISAFAQTAPEIEKTECEAGRDMLGVFRVVEIDTTGGPLFGQMQYPDFDFLAEGEIVLTFDDGPLRRYTLPVLEALESHCAKATFFVVGRMAVVDPAMVKEMVRRGHTVGTHTWSHRKLRAVREKSAENEIELGISAVSQALGQPVAPFFRFPYLGDSKSALGHLKARNIAVFSVDIDAKDFKTRSASEVQRRVLSDLEDKKKGIILFHDIQVSTARALKGLLGELKARGYKIVHLVAKKAATTVPDYDMVAEREFARRKVAAAHPLADRSIVWPMAEDAAEEGESLSKKKPSRFRRKKAKGSKERATARENATDIHLDHLRQ